MAQSVSLVLDDFARVSIIQLTHPNLLCYRTKRMLLISQEAERRENVVDAQPRSQVMNKAHLAERFLRMSGGCEYESRDRARIRMRVGLPPRLERPIRGLDRKSTRLNSSHLGIS